MSKEGESLKVEGTAVRDSVERVVGHNGTSDHVNIPSEFRKFLKKKVVISVVRKEKTFGKYVFIIEGKDE